MLRLLAAITGFVLSVGILAISSPPADATSYSVTFFLYHPRRDRQPRTI